LACVQLQRRFVRGLSQRARQPCNSFLLHLLIFSLEGAAYRLRGEGTGSKIVTDAALKELQSLSASDILNLRRETVAVKKP
jgi:hypothetical protein